MEKLNVLVDDIALPIKHALVLTSIKQTNTGRNDFMV